MSAILLPFFDDGSVDWKSFEAHVERTVDAGLVPAVNMDTGFAALIDESTRQKVLKLTRSVTGGGEFIAGAFVSDHEGAPFALDKYASQIATIQSAGGTPILFQSYGLAHGNDDTVIGNYGAIASECERFLAFELGTMFAPFGRIYPLETYKRLIQIPECYGAKHSSLQRQLEWDRIRIRDETRPEFMVLTGNDLAIDMVMYGSDYLLGLSTFCPDLFARRDQMWLEGSAEFYQLNDVLQYLGFFAFRNPTSAYKHSAAMFLKIRRWITSDRTHDDSPHRPDPDREILLEIARQLEVV